jgi:large subunit ribosomal protein L15
MNLHDLKPASGSIKKSKRIGRGQGSGRGGTSTRGHKGASSRSGFSYKAGFEGGQMPLKLRVPKFGFKNPNRVEYAAINLDVLQMIVDRYGDSTITPEILKSHGIVSNLKSPIKILGRGEVKTALTVKANAFSESAKNAIIAAGGSVDVI